MSRLEKKARALAAAVRNGISHLQFGPQDGTLVLHTVDVNRMEDRLNDLRWVLDEAERERAAYLKAISQLDEAELLRFDPDTPDDEEDESLADQSE